MITLGIKRSSLKGQVGSLDSEIMFFIQRIKGEILTRDANLRSSHQYGGPEVQLFCTNHNFFYKPQLFSTNRNYFLHSCNFFVERRGRMGSRFSCVAAGMEKLIDLIDLTQAVENIVGCGSV